MRSVPALEITMHNRKTEITLNANTAAHNSTILSKTDQTACMMHDCMILQKYC